MKQTWILALGCSLALFASTHLFAQDGSSGGSSSTDAPPYCPLSAMIDFLEGIIENPDGSMLSSLGTAIEMIEELELCDGVTMGSGVGSGGIVSRRIFTLGPDGELVEVDGETSTFGDGAAMFGGVDLIDLSLDDLLEDLDFDSIEDSITGMLAGMDFDFDIDINADCDFQGFDLQEFDLGSLLPEGLDLSGLVSGGVSSHVIMVGPDGTTTEWNGGDADFGALDFPGLGDSLDAILDLLDGLDISGATTSVQTSVSSKAFTLGPDGEWIQISGDGQGSGNIEDLIDQLEDMLEGDE